MDVKVSVVVPVYNPGIHIEDCISSLLGQSLSDDEYEVHFVDDGSTDGSGERLEAIAADHDNVHVTHIPNSGWPGRPRNVGVDASVGEYVYFVDNDDWLGPEALERMYAMAKRNDADIVVGKVVGVRRRIPREIFRRSVDRATLADHPLLSMLTPHKLFRRSFLERHDIRFPEGRRRLEDHVYVTKAYLLADTISILSDYPCYHWVRREDESNASRQGFEPASYYGNVREVLDIVEEHTEPGPFRDTLLRHWYRGKMLGRMGGRTLLAYEPGYRKELFEEIRRLAQERFGPGVVAGLPANLRLRSWLLLHGDIDRLVALAKQEGAVRAAVQVGAAKWEGERLRLELSGRLEHGDGSPVRYRRAGTRVLLKVDDDEAPDEILDVTAELRRSRLDVVVTARESKAEFLLPTRSSYEQRSDGRGGITLELTSVAHLDPLSAAARAPLGSGTWDVAARVVSTGWDLTTRLGAPPDLAADLAPAVIGRPGRAVVPYLTKFGNVSVHVEDETVAAPPLRRRRSPARVQVDDRHVTLLLRLPVPRKEWVPGPVLALLRSAWQALPSGLRGRLLALRGRFVSSRGGSDEVVRFGW